MNSIAPNKSILLLGEFGGFGRFVASALARVPGVALTLGTAEPERVAAFAAECGAQVQRVDLVDSDDVARACRDRFAVINTVGPFLEAEYSIAEAALAAGAHYIDPADTRAYVAGFEGLDRRAQTARRLLVTGVAPVPAIAAALVEMAVGDFDRLTEIETFLAPGSHGRRELATARAIVDFLDESIRVKERGRWRQAPGWQRPRSVVFPDPVGKRRGYLCDTADLDLFPSYFGAQTVSARAGIRSLAFNRGVGLLALLRRLGAIKRVPLWAQRHLRAAVQFSPALPGAALRVEVRGPVDGIDRRHALTLFSRQDNGHLIAAAPIVALLRQWVRDGVSASGARPCLGLLHWEALRAELLKDDDVALVRSWE